MRLYCECVNVNYNVISQKKIRKNTIFGGQNVDLSLSATDM